MLNVDLVIYYEILNDLEMFVYWIGWIGCVGRFGMNIFMFIS